MKTDERFGPWIEHWPGNGDAIDGIGAIENNHSTMVLGGSFHRFAHGGDVGVESGPDVLDIKNERIDIGQHGGCRSPCFAIQAINFLRPVVASWLSATRGNIELPFEAVFGTEEAAELDVGSIAQ